VKKSEEIQIDFEIDKLTNSIENAISGEVFDTHISQISETRKIKKSDWVFEWHSEIKSNSKSVYCLTTLNNQKIIQGLISITDKGDHIFMDLIESAKFNKGKGKLYKGVAGNLVAFACKTSFEKAMKELYRLLQKHNLLTITQKHWVQNFLAETECLLTPKNHKF
jgi:hypothetical protein